MVMISVMNRWSVLEAAHALISTGMFDLGWNWIVLDDCWAAGHRNVTSNELQWDINRFPNGIPALINSLHALGLFFGLYTSAGNTTCSSGGRPYSIPGSEGNYQLDMDTFASWNVDYVKVDWCGDVKNEYAKGNKLYKDISYAANYTTPARTIYLNGVGAYPFLMTEVGVYMNSWRAWSDHHDEWSTTWAQIAAMQIVGHLGEPGAWPDMDVLTTGGEGCKDQPNTTLHCPGQTNNEYLTEISLWTLNQSPLLVATDIRNMTSIMNIGLLNANISRIHQDTRTPPGRHIGYWPCTKDLTCSLWARHMIDGSVIVGLLNSGAKEETIQIDFSTIGWQNDTAVNVYNIWQSSPVGVFTNNYSTRVATHATVLLELRINKARR